MILLGAIVLLGSGDALGVPPGADVRGGKEAYMPVVDTELSYFGEARPRSVAEPTLLAESSAVGGDNCNTAAVVPLTVGAPGSPNTITINGNTTPATDGGCTGYSTAIWWEAFEIDKCATVTIDSCGSTPVLSPSFVQVYRSCAADGSTCGDIANVDFFTRDICGDGNGTLFFDALPPGTYYYPIIADTSGGRGPYVLHVTAEECSGACAGCLGGCCDPVAETCTDLVSEPSCSGLNEQWLFRGGCCDSECRDPGGPMFDAQGVELLSWTPLSEFPSGSLEANDVWGYTSPLGRKYGIIGLYAGTGFVDITDPRNPVVIADIPDSSSIWSDMAVYKQYAYNVNETGGGMQIIDLSQIDSGVVTLRGSAMGGMRTAHNVYVNPESGFAYACGTDVAPGIMAFDLTNPSNPQPVGVFNFPYLHDLYAQSYDSCPLPARLGEPCEIVFGFAGDVGLVVIDVTDKTAMVQVASLTYPTVAYCHQGWLSDDHRYVYFNDELDEYYGTVAQTQTYVADVQDMLNPTLVETFEHPGCWIDHNLIPRGDRIYQAHYAAGLRVLDAADPLNLSEVAYFDTHPENNEVDFVGAWGVYTGLAMRVVLISDIERGLFVLCDQPEIPVPSFTVNQNPVPALQTVNFNASYSTTCDPARSLVLFEWDFDYDGVTFDTDATGPSPSHAFATEDPTTVALRVTDDLAATEIATLCINCEDAVSTCPVAAKAVDNSAMVDAGFGGSPRFLSFMAGEPGASQAVRVTFPDPMPAPFQAWSGLQMWVGPPTRYCENSGNFAAPSSTPPNYGCDAAPNLERTYMASTLQCEPHYQDWHGTCAGSTCAGGLRPGTACSVDNDCLAPIYVYHEGIIPSTGPHNTPSITKTTYSVQVLNLSCDTAAEDRYSSPLLSTTSKWGDTVENTVFPFPPPEGIVQITDVLAILQKFQNLGTASISARVDLIGASAPKHIVDHGIDIGDVLQALFAFQAVKYPSLAIPDTPGPVPCGP